MPHAPAIQCFPHSIPFQAITGLRRYLLTAWLKPGLAILPFATVSYAVELHWPAHNLFLFFIQIALCFPLALVAFWGICLSPLQRADYSQRFWTLRGHAVPRPMEGTD